MTTPTVHGFPIKRTGFITQAQFSGPDDDLTLQLSYVDSDGITKSMSFTTTNASQQGEICLPSSNDVADLADTPERVKDILAAHVRMACQIKGLAVPGSQEFEDAVLNQLESPKSFQTAIGTVTVEAITLVDDVCVKLDFKSGGGSPTRTYTFDYAELENYAFVPATQLLVVAGAIKAQFSNYIHDDPSTTLNSSKKQDIVDYVLGLDLWL